MSASVRIRRLAVFEPEATIAADVAAYVRIVNDAARRDTGHDDLSTWDAPSVLGECRARDDWIVDVLLADVEGTVVGATRVASLAADARQLEFDIALAPDASEPHVAEALLAAADDERRARGLRTLQGWSMHRPAPGARMIPSTGAGWIPADDGWTRFYAERGFTLEQVERNSALDLDSALTGVRRVLEQATRAAAGRYRVVAFTDHCPEQYAAGLAYAMSRMSTDAPQGGLDVEEETWDVARLRRREERKRAQGITASIVIAVEENTSEVAAFTELTIGEDPEAAGQQWGTLVLAEHRGHRLGQWVKAAGILRWHEVAPRSRRITTFNAEENRHMLAINVELGFTPRSFAGAWRRDSLS